ncbi:MAG: proteasome subunit alpha, partial [Candidatus Thorarchaeota archaeon]
GSPKLFVTDPVGTYWGFLASIIGRGTARAGEFLEQRYNRKMSLNDAIEVGLGSLREATEKELTVDNVEIVKIPTKTRKFEKLSNDEIASYLQPTKPK